MMNSTDTEDQSTSMADRAKILCVNIDYKSSTESEQKEQSSSEDFSPFCKINELDAASEAFSKHKELSHLMPQSLSNYDFTENIEEDLISEHRINNVGRLVNRITHGVNPDIIIQIGNTDFKCYYIVLSYYSERIKEHTESKIRLDENIIDAETFKLIYKWMMSAHMNIPEEHFVKIYTGAFYLKIKQLQQQCLSVFDGEHFSELHGFVMLFENRNNIYLEKIHDIIISRIYKSFLTIVSGMEFQMLNERHIMQMLSTDHCGVNLELEVFYAAAIWLTYQWPLRKNYAEPVLSCVRFNFLPNQFLLKLTRDDRYTIMPYQELMEYMSQSDKIVKLVKSGLLYSSIVSSYYHDKNNFIKHLNKCSLPYVPRRHWLLDANCKYHQKPTKYSPSKYLLTYEDFCDYLKSLFRQGNADYLKYISEC